MLRSKGMRHFIIVFINDFTSVSVYDDNIKENRVSYLNEIMKKKSGNKVKMICL